MTLSDKLETIFPFQEESELSNSSPIFRTIYRVYEKAISISQLDVNVNLCYLVNLLFSSQTHILPRFHKQKRKQKKIRGKNEKKKNWKGRKNSWEFTRTRDNMVVIALVARIEH